MTIICSHSDTGLKEKYDKSILMMLVHWGSQHSTPPRHFVALSPSRGRKVQRHHLLFPLEGKCRAAAKGCTRPRVEKKRKGCPDRQTAACLGGVSSEALAVQHPRATTWPSPPRWEACHLILSRLRLPANQVPLPPQGSARGSGALCSCHLKGRKGKRTFLNHR